MYWQVGYFWQENVNDPSWCVTCRECTLNGNMELRKCKDVSADFEFEDVGNGKVRIHYFHGGAEYCLTHGYTWLKMKVCDGNKNLEFEPGLGDFWNGNKFELKKPGSTECETTGHHPKAFEHVRRFACSKCRYDSTNYWIKYE